MKNNEVASPRIYGLVLAGGLSSRMKKDKGELNYHGIPQVEYTFNLLAKFCNQTFISCRTDQGHLKHLSQLPQIHDSYFEGGPLGAILSAMDQHRDVAWLVFACDLPLLNSSVIENILEQRDPNKSATAFFNLDENRFEPLAALYEPKSYDQMKSFFAAGKTCPQKVLYNSEVKIINFKNGEPIEKNLRNINTTEEFLDINLHLESRESF